MAWEPGRPIEWNGLTLDVQTIEDRDPTGSTYVLHRRSVENAARALMGSTRVMETQRNSGVLQLTVSDSDPRRAAAKANALCLNYFDLKVERSRRKASQSIPFIESQLEEQNELLTEVEEEVARQVSDRADFEKLGDTDRERQRIDDEINELKALLPRIEAVLSQAREVAVAIGAAPGRRVPDAAIADVRAQMGGLLRRGFVAATGRRRLPDVVRYLLGEIKTTIIHGEENPLNLQPTVQMFLHQADGIQKFTQSL